MPLGVLVSTLLLLHLLRERLVLAQFLLTSCLLRGIETLLQCSEVLTELAGRVELVERCVQLV